MKSVQIIIAVALGGGIGALIRHGGEKVGHMAEIPAWAAVLIINVIGSGLIGFLLVWLDVRLRRSGRSRLEQHPMKQHLSAHPGLLQPDLTLPPTELARFHHRLQLESGFYMTGLMGGLTTVSSWSLDTVNLLVHGELTTAIINMSMSLLITVAAVLIGLEIGRRCWIQTTSRQ